MFHFKWFELKKQPLFPESIVNWTRNLSASRLIASKLLYRSNLLNLKENQARLHKYVSLEKDSKEGMFRVETVSNAALGRMFF